MEVNSANKIHDLLVKYRDFQSKNARNIYTLKPDFVFLNYFIEEVKKGRFIFSFMDLVKVEESFKSKAEAVKSDTAIPTLAKDIARVTDDELVLRYVDESDESAINNAREITKSENGNVFIEFLMAEKLNNIKANPMPVSKRFLGLLIPEEGVDKHTWRFNSIFAQLLAILPLLFTLICMTCFAMVFLLYGFRYSLFEMLGEVTFAWWYGNSLLIGSLSAMSAPVIFLFTSIYTVSWWRNITA